MKGVKIYEVPVNLQPSHSHGGRDYYKIVLVTGKVLLGYSGRTVTCKDTFLFFANPHLPHSVEHLSRKNKAFACLFTETFIAGRERKGLLQHSPLFRIGASPVIPVSGAQAAFLVSLFQQMLDTSGSDYEHREDMLRNCIALIIHEAMRLQPAEDNRKEKDAAARITYLFLELLEQQFPVDNTGDPLRLRNPHDFANALSVHVNYLNRSVRKVTGKPTSAHIAERIAAEAVSLLQHSDWNIADIAYSLGFEYPTYFNNYFKRVTGKTPTSFRKEKV
ncbi:helix-turn-helix domain-containing protein [Chitinophaga solisilvae]|uniref:helix-turn-helix domain-containing protein n=1 Tax=Chitinophaga solisilvae TaxID=1233460 RepID=UPI00136FD133|nr:helix-turn-helix domain-containing protein [Chitinophaga solisilvae]